MNAEIIPDWLQMGNIWQMICGLVTEVGERMGGGPVGGFCGWVLTVEVETMSKEGLEGLRGCCVVAAAGGD